LWFGSQAESAEITLHSPDAYGRFFVDIVGEITPNDEKAFEQKVKVLYTQYDKVIVTLSGPGGVALAAMQIGEFIHKYGWTTYVPSGTVCVSSCAIIWLAGKPRTIEGAPGVIIGFHAVYDVGTQRESGVANAVLGYHLTRWGLNDRGIACVTIAPPNEIGWLTGPNGRECGITWEVLTPARDVPLQLSPIAPSTTTAQRQQVIYLNCTPTLAANEPDPVTGIPVGLKVISQENNPHVEYFDAWHHTSSGYTYKRSEQYVDRSLKIPNVNERRWTWEGRWIKDRNVLMIGQLAITNRVYTYKEWIFHGDPGPQNRSEEVTNSVCKEVKQ